MTLGYDASGNLTSDGTWTFAYDAENMMRSAAKSGTAASYAYDPLLRREGKTVNGVTTTFLLDGAEEIGEYDGAGAMLRRFVPSIATDAPIAMIEGTGGATVRKWFHRNRLGSTIAMSDGAGLVSEGPVTYDPFGNSTSTGGVPFKYTGSRLDPETGLYFYRARYYSPALGRFMQVDPIGSCDNLNLYAYVGNDPMNLTDPTGLYMCNGSKEQCASVASGLTNIEKAAANLETGSKEQKALQKVLNFYGKEGQKNGVNVGFRDRGAPGQTRRSGGEINIMFNLGGLQRAVEGRRDGSRVDVEKAGAIAHEGQHGVDIRAMGRGPINRWEVYQAERNGYRTQSYVNQGLNTPSAYGLWSPGMSEVGRNYSINVQAARSVEIDCQESGGAC